MKMTMDQKRKIVIGGVAIGAVMILLGNTVISITGLIVAFAALSLQYVWFRCKNCGIFIQLWHYKEGVECPQCGKKLG